MNVKVIVHEAEEGGYWGEVPALPGCASQGETIEDLMRNLREAIEGYLAGEVDQIGEGERVLDLALRSSGAVRPSLNWPNGTVGNSFA